MKKISILNTIRLAKNVSIREMSRAMGVSYGTTPQYFESDKNETIGIGTLDRACKTLGITLRQYCKEREEYYKRGV